MVVPTGPVGCDVPGCERSFGNLHGLNVHKHRMHGVALNGTPAKKSPKRKISEAERRRKYRTMFCEVCDAGPFHTKASLGSHLRKTHGIEGKSRSSLDRRKKAGEDQPADATLGRCPFCPACGYPLTAHHIAMEVTTHANRR